jgi:hypothetical protein
MSTSIDQIIAVLKANANEKQKQIHGSYREKSVWLANELAVIKKLIQNNPRDNQIPSVDAQEVVPTAASSSDRTSLDKKRKVPDTVNTVKLSPEQKRASIDADDLIAQAGLPADLNKLTKEQLLKELKKLGRTEYSTKQVKKELVDGLKEALVEVHRAKLAPVDAISLPAEAATETAAAPQDSFNSSSEMVLSTPGKPTAAVRRGSQMSDFRAMVTQQTASVAPIATAAPAVENEFLARQNRHRESVARKSLAVAPSDVTAAETAAPVVVEAAVPPPVPSTPAPTLSLDKSAIYPEDPAKPDKTTIYPEDNVWMEVSSPARSAAPVEAVSAEAKAPVVVPDISEKSVAPAETPVAPQAEEVAVQSESVAAPVAAEDGRARSESDASFKSCLSTASAPKSTSAKESTRAPTGSTKPASSLRAGDASKPTMSAASAKPSVVSVPSAASVRTPLCAHHLIAFCVARAVHFAKGEDDCQHHRRSQLWHCLCSRGAGVQEEGTCPRGDY